MPNCLTSTPADLDIHAQDEQLSIKQTTRISTLRITTSSDAAPANSVSDVSGSTPPTPAEPFVPAIEAELEDPLSGAELFPGGTRSEAMAVTIGAPPDQF